MGIAYTVQKSPDGTIKYIKNTAGQGTKTTSGLAGNVPNYNIPGPDGVRPPVTPQTATGSASINPPSANSLAGLGVQNAGITNPNAPLINTPTANLGKVGANGDVTTFDELPPNGQTFDATNYQNFLNNKPTQPIIQQQPDITGYINGLADAQKKARIAALDSAKTNSLANLDTEQANIEPNYYNKRNQAQANADVGAMNFAQFMASRGIKGNAGAMPEIYRNAGLQGQIGALDQQENQDLSGISRQRGNINNNYQSDVANANASVDSQAMQNSIDQWNKNRDYNLNLGQATGNINGTPTLAGKQYTQGRQDTYANNLGVAINPTADKTVPTDIQNRINSVVNSQYGGDYQAYMQDHPEDQVYGTALRNSKIYGDLGQYGQYAPQTLSGINAGLQNKKAELDNTATQLQNSVLPDTLKLQVKRLQQQVDTGSLDYDTTLAQLRKLQTDNQYAPGTYQADIGLKGAQANYYNDRGVNAIRGGGLTTTQQKNSDMASDYGTLKSMSVTNAASQMNSRWADMISKYGTDGAKQLWNSVLADAIAARTPDVYAK